MKRSKMKVKQKKKRFIDLILGTLAAGLLANLLAGKGVKAKMPGRGVIRSDKGITFN